MSGWGKAGVRLSARDANRIKLSAALGRQRKEADLAEARALWGQGKMVPHRITMALDICGLYGPDVDVRTSLEFHMPGSPPKPHILSFHPTAHTAQRTVEQGVLW